MQKSDINVLIVDDDITQRESLLAAVKKLGYKGVAVKRPEEAESLARLKPIHGLIVDCMLPGKSGVDLVVGLKSNIVDEAKIIFISGIYRDKVYQQEAIAKTGAINFFQKPFNIDELMANLEKELAHLVEVPKVDLHALLAAPMASQRDRRKALDHVEEMFGYDIPFVFCILMESESSGHLNMVDEKQNIYGVTFAKGLISKIDSENTVIQTRNLLIKHGYITQKDLDEVTNKTSSDIIKALIDESLLSPHVRGLIKAEQIIEELQKFVSGTKLKINFVPDRKVKPEGDDLDMSTFLPSLHEMIGLQIPFEYLKTFYKSWQGHPIRLGPNYQGQIQVLALPLVKRADGLIELFKKEPTIEDVLVGLQIDEETFYRALHMLALRRIVVFDENRRVRNVDEHVNRLKGIYSSVKGKGPIEIFKYFGLGDTPKAKEVSQIYKEFAKSNHPDTLPQSVSAEIRKLNHELFALVADAHDVLTDDRKKEAYLNRVKQEGAEKQLQSEDLLAEAYSLIGRGKFIDAVPKVKKSLELYQTEKGKLYRIWVETKADLISKEKVILELDHLKKFSSETKKTALYTFVQGIVRKKAGLLDDAQKDFARALQLDENFMDARRELASVKSSNAGDKTSMNDMLTGDITQVFTKMFKKKGA